MGWLLAWRLVIPDSFAQTPVRDPLVYYQILYLSFLERSACGDDVRGWLDGLRTIRDILSSDLGRSERDLAAIESRAADLQRGVPCDSDTRRDLLSVTAGEPQRALTWFRTQKSPRIP
ncbi:hypothetical protein CWS72_11405 [Telmatospirillum siberiense]|uniref:Uncharacterized protein n=2 Tax=Telmatospirillum siberiense TaxID=382514 RepID=A0A2N3PVN0_9PROT|nr:hypothetical protein CWS72_11405 [Telmatospirillum siberiense]